VISLFAVYHISNITFYKYEAPVELIDELNNNPDIIELVQLPVMKKKILKIVEAIKAKNVVSFEKKEIIKTLVALNNTTPDIQQLQLSNFSNKIIIPPLIKPIRPKKKDKIYEIVERMPLFGSCNELDGEEAKKCSDKAIMEYLSNSIRYPGLAKEINLEGRVIVEFIIDEDGMITKPRILRDIGAGCGDEVIRVISKMPDWAPGFQQNRNVKVKIRVPVNFKLN
jgi:TonB family protein